MKPWEPYVDQLDGRAVVISGGSSGIGRKLAGFLSEHDADVTVLSSNDGKLRRIESELGVRTIACDISSVESVRSLPLERLDVLINCAAILGPVGKFEENDAEEWKRTIDVDLTGNALLIHALLPALKRGRHPKVINVGGGGAGYSRPFHTAYAAAKTGMVRLTEILADEYRGEVEFNIIAPGAHRTPMWERETHDSPPDEWADDGKLFGLVSFLIARHGITGRFLHIENDWAKLDPAVSDTARFQLRRTD